MKHDLGNCVVIAASSTNETVGSATMPHESMWVGQMRQGYPVVRLHVPRELGGVFGSARRINSLIIQAWYSLM